MGENGQLGLMGTRKNEHQGKSAIEANGHLRPMHIGAKGHQRWSRYFLKVPAVPVVGALLKVPAVPVLGT